MHNRRRFLRNASLISSGIVLGGRNVALAESARELIVRNDYDASIEVDVFHPNSLTKAMATWVIPSLSRTRLTYNGELLRVQTDWGIRVRFQNGCQ